MSTFFIDKAEKVLKLGELIKVLDNKVIYIKDALVQISSEVVVELLCLRVTRQNEHLWFLCYASEVRFVPLENTQGLHH